MVVKSPCFVLIFNRLFTVPCKKPMDVMFLLKAGKQLEDMKTVVQAFIKSADIGRLHQSLVWCVQHYVQVS